MLKFCSRFGKNQIISQIQHLQRHEPSHQMRSQCKLSFEGFARYLMDKDNYAFNNEHAKIIEEEMDR